MNKNNSFTPADITVVKRLVQFENGNQMLLDFAVFDSVEQEECFTDNLFAEFENDYVDSSPWTVFDENIFYYVNVWEGETFEQLKNPDRGDFWIIDEEAN